MDKAKIGDLFVIDRPGYPGRGGHITFLVTKTLDSDYFYCQCRYSYKVTGAPSEKRMYRLEHMRHCDWYREGQLIRSKPVS